MFTEVKTIDKDGKEFILKFCTQQYFIGLYLCIYVDNSVAQQCTATNVMGVKFKTEDEFHHLVRIRAEFTGDTIIEDSSSKLSSYNFTEKQIAKFKEKWQKQIDKEKSNG